MRIVLCYSTYRHPGSARLSRRPKHVPSGASPPAAEAFARLLTSARRTIRQLEWRCRRAKRGYKTRLCGVEWRLENWNYSKVYAYSAYRIIARRLSLGACFCEGGPFIGR